MLMLQILYERDIVVRDGVLVQNRYRASAYQSQSETNRRRKYGNKDWKLENQKSSSLNVWDDSENGYPVQVKPIMIIVTQNPVLEVMYQARNQGERREIRVQRKSF